MEIVIDIETIPSQPEEETKAEISKTIKAPSKMTTAKTIAEWHEGEGKYEGAKYAAIEQQYRKGSLDGGTGELISACIVIDGETTAFDISGRSEKETLIHLFETIGSASRGQPYFIGHNLKFDLEFLWKRAVILGVKPEFKLPFNGRHKADYFCTMQAWCGYGKMISQDNLCRILGMPLKPEGISGANVYDHYKRGELARIVEYNRYDTETAGLIHDRLIFK